MRATKSLMAILMNKKMLRKIILIINLWILHTNLKQVIRMFIKIQKQNNLYIHHIVENNHKSLSHLSQKENKTLLKINIQTMSNKKINKNLHFQLELVKFNKK
jgi:lipopolysaccharide biosynthesis regulator YciM